METKQAMTKRRSIRRFIDKEISEDLLQQIMHGAMSGPSAMNTRPWDFFIIKNKKLLEKIRLSGRYCNYNGDVAIVVTGDLTRTLPGNSSQFWVQDCSSATAHILLMATDLGLGSVWCGVYPKEKEIKEIQNILNLKENQIPLNVIWLGYPDGEIEQRDQYEAEKVHIIR